MRNSNLPAHESPDGRLYRTIRGARDQAKSRSVAKPVKFPCTRPDLQSQSSPHDAPQPATFAAAHGMACRSLPRRPKSSPTNPFKINIYNPTRNC